MITMLEIREKDDAEALIKKQLLAVKRELDSACVAIERGSIKDAYERIPMNEIKMVCQNMESFMDALD